ncbi:hypothetical protein ERJ75_000524900 [Trypanosoma vivax]|nr:hypothetical protein ERJ75_000524900 [Trypanosoma vivax]
MVHWSALRGSRAGVRLPRCARLAARGAFPVPSLSLMTSRRAAQGASAYRARASTRSQRAWAPHAGSFAAEDKDAGERVWRFAAREVHMVQAIRVARYLALCAAIAAIACAHAAAQRGTEHTMPQTTQGRSATRQAK